MGDVATLLSRAPYCQWENITAPSLLIHDPKDPFVPIAHAEAALAMLSRATLRKFTLGGHMIWVGQGSANARDKEFLRQYA